MASRVYMKHLPGENEAEAQIQDPEYIPIVPSFINVIHIY